MDKDEALKIIEMHLDSQDAKLREACSVFIPELAECNGEKVRSKLLAYFRSCSENSFFVGLPVKNIVGWFEQQPGELINGEDYGINGLERAIDILERTLGSVEGYQTDDGILEHEIAIDTLKAFKQKAWTEEDERRLNSLKCAIMCYQEQHPFTTDAKGDMEWVNNFKERLCPQHHWIPTEEQMKALDMGIREVWTKQDSERLMSLYKDLKKLRDDNSRTKGDCEQL